MRKNKLKLSETVLYTISLLGFVIFLVLASVFALKISTLKGCMVLSLAVTFIPILLIVCKNVIKDNEV